MDIIFSAFSVICFILAFLVGFILFFVNKKNVFTNRLLALVLLFFGIQNFVSYLFYSGFIVKIPHIYKVFAPTTFLIFPLCYFYVRSILKLQTTFQRYDWLILIPSILYAINLYPVYTLSYEKKIILVEHYLKNLIIHGQFNEGVLPPYVFSFIRTGWSAYFLFLQFKLINQFKKNVSNRFIEINKDLLNWLYLFSFLLLFFISIFIVFTVLTPLFNLSLRITDIALQIIVLSITFKLFSKPNILYGIHFPLENITINGDEDFTQNNNIGTFEDTADNNALIKSYNNDFEYKSIVESHFNTNLPFLNPNYNLNNLSKAIGLPKHIISTFINQEYGIGFRKFINQKRVHYLIENFIKPEWKNLTLEAKANESGFKNRSTFIINFKEVTGKNPFEYFKNIKN
jgi:AraC-like DNA-binding protein